MAIEELETVSTTARSRLAINIIRTTTEEPQPTAQPQGNKIVFDSNFIDILQSFVFLFFFSFLAVSSSISFS